jgi:hypothetical protein
MTAVHIGDQLDAWVAKAINDGAMGEEFWHDHAGSTVMGPVGPSLRYTVIITMKNPLLGQGPLIMPFTVPIGAMREDAVRLGVHNAMGQLRELHKQLLDAKPRLVPGGRNIHS